MLTEPRVPEPTSPPARTTPLLCYPEGTHIHAQKGTMEMFFFRARPGHVPLTPPSGKDKLPLCGRAGNRWLSAPSGMSQLQRATSPAPGHGLLGQLTCHEKEIRKHKDLAIWIKLGITWMVGLPRAPTRKGRAYVAVPKPAALFLSQLLIPNGHLIPHSPNLRVGFQRT